MEIKKTVEMLNFNFGEGNIEIELDIGIFNFKTKEGFDTSSPTFQQTDKFDLEPLDNLNIKAVKKEDTITVRRGDVFSYEVGIDFPFKRVPLMLYVVRIKALPRPQEEATKELINRAPDEYRKRYTRSFTMPLDFRDEFGSLKTSILKSMKGLLKYNEFCKVIDAGVMPSDFNKSIEFLKTLQSFMKKEAEKELHELFNEVYNELEYVETRLKIKLGEGHEDIEKHNEFFRRLEQLEKEKKGIVQMINQHIDDKLIDQVNPKDRDTSSAIKRHLMTRGYVVQAKSLKDYKNLTEEEQAKHVMALAGMIKESEYFESFKFFTSLYEYMKEDIEWIDFTIKWIAYLDGSYKSGKNLLEENHKKLGNEYAEGVGITNKNIGVITGMVKELCKPVLERTNVPGERGGGPIEPASETDKRDKSLEEGGKGQAGKRVSVRAIIETRYGILLVDDMIRRNKGSARYALPGGTVDSGRTDEGSLKAALQKELYEELGLKHIDSAKLTEFRGSSVNGVPTIHHIFVAKVEAKTITKADFDPKTRGLDVPQEVDGIAFLSGNPEVSKNELQGNVKGAEEAYTSDIRSRMRPSYKSDIEVDPSILGGFKDITDVTDRA